MRKPFQGVRNVIRFNWPFYAVALAAGVVLLLVSYYTGGWPRIVALSLLVIGSVLTLVSLTVTLYVYDLSGFYELGWLDHIPVAETGTLVNLNAGFDETSGLLAERFPEAEIVVCDFYDPAKHTAASIRRAREAYPCFAGTQGITTRSLPLPDDTAANIFAIMSLHEVRDDNERGMFLAELNRILTADGRIIIVEHVRDAANCLAYNFGAFHFHTRKAWLHNFKVAGLRLESEQKATPWLTVFVLKTNGAEP
jgi:SAM-dependent methyltransferase